MENHTRTDSIRSEETLIYLVDDSEICCALLREILTAMNYTNIRCFYYPEAVISAITSGCASAILISDYCMPKMNGVQLLKKVRELRPEIKSVLLTGNPIDALKECSDFVVIDKGTMFENQLKETLDTFAAEIKAARV